MFKTISRATAFIAALLGVVAPAFAQGTFTVFDAPNSTGTIGYVLDDTGNSAGWYNGVDGMQHGFVRSGNGTIVVCDPPGSVLTYVLGMSSAGVSGVYLTSDGVSHGFLRTSAGNIVSFDPPDAVQTIQAYGITSTGAVAGSYIAADGLLHGFLRDPQGVFSTFDPPGSISTNVRDINSSGSITGSVSFGDGIAHGFIHSAAGVDTVFDAPNSSLTGGIGINAAGAVSGFNIDDRYNGFVRDAAGNLTVFNVPGSPNTLAYHINDAGFIDGVYDDGYAQWAFIRDPLGNFSTIAPPGATGSSLNMITTGGSVAGYFTDAGGVAHGFTYTPSPTITGLATQVAALMASLGLNNDTGVTSILAAAQKSEAKGDKKAAAGQLNAFINKVNVLKKKGTIDASTASSLTTSAQALIGQL